MEVLKRDPKRERIEGGWPEQVRDFRGNEATLKKTQKGEWPRGA